MHSIRSVSPEEEEEVTFLSLSNKKPIIIINTILFDIARTHFISTKESEMSWSGFGIKFVSTKNDDRSTDWHADFILISSWITRMVTNTFVIFGQSDPIIIIIINWSIASGDNATCPTIVSIIWLTKIMDCKLKFLRWLLFSILWKFIFCFCIFFMWWFYRLWISENILFLHGFGLLNDHDYPIETISIENWSRFFSSHLCKSGRTISNNAGMFFLLLFYFIIIW